MHCNIKKPCYTKSLLYLIVAIVFILFSWDEERLLLARQIFSSAFVVSPALADTPLPDKSHHIVPLKKIKFVTPLGMLNLNDISSEMLINLRNQIIPVDNPEFVPANSITDLNNDDLVIGYNDDDDAWAFPVKILNHREIVNATLNGTPLLVSYCPLCGSGIVYDRRLKDDVLHFGNSHGLYESDMVMFDYQTGSLWQQITGTALVGSLSGHVLKTLSSMTTTWAGWKHLYPATKILKTEFATPLHFNSGRYRSALNHGQFHASGVNDSAKDDRLAAGTRVMSINFGKHTYVYPLPDKFEKKVAMQQLENVSLLIVFYGRGGMIFHATIDNQSLTFELFEGHIRDRQTHSLWDFTGVAKSGQLQGKKLKKLPVRNSYWFAIAAIAKNITVINI